LLCRGIHSAIVATPYPVNRPGDRESSGRPLYTMPVTRSFRAHGES
jgi:hypothetical protein